MPVVNMYCENIAVDASASIMQNGIHKPNDLFRNLLFIISGGYQL